MASWERYVRLTEQRIHESVDRIVAAKKQLGLFDTPLHPPLARGEKEGGGLARGEAKGGGSAKIDYEAHRAVARELGGKALTLLRGDRKQLPFESGKSIACFVLDDDAQGMGGPFTRELIKRFGAANSTTLTPDLCEAGLSAHLDLGASGSVAIAIFSRISASKGRSGISPKLRDAAFEILRRSKAEGRRSVVISFDSPYILEQFKDADYLIAGYDRMDAIQEAAAEMLGSSSR